MVRPLVPQRFLDVLRAIVERLDDGQVIWVVTGSLGMALQGVPRQPHDIDLQTDAPGAYEIEARFRPQVIRPVRWSTTGRLRSHFGTLLVGGLEVEIIGDIQKRLPDGTWTPAPDLERHRRLVEVAGMRVPVLDLAYEAEAYAQMGRVARAEALQQWLHQNPG